MGRHYSARPGAKGPTDADVLPTPERRNHGPVERLERPIGDNSGRPARPYRAIDTLAVMERRGSITAAMRQAGENFRARFMTAQLDPLSAFDLSRPRAGRHSSFRSREEPGFRIDNAREAVARNPRCGRPRFSRRLVSVARPRVGTVAEGVGARARLEWATG